MIIPTRCMVKFTFGFTYLTPNEAVFVRASV
jgi:hypothetical protein